MEFEPLTVENAPARAAALLRNIPACPDTFAGRGIVISAGGVRYLTCAWVLVNMLRRLGCSLPIEIWYLGEDEHDAAWIELVEPLGVRCVDAREVNRRSPEPHERLGGWESKAFAILNCAFQEVLFLDADNVPVVDPAYLTFAPSGQAASNLAASFDGSSYASVPHNAAFNAMPLSISLWIANTEPNTGLIDFLSMQSSDDGFGWRLENAAQPDLVYNGGLFASVLSEINDGNWHHVVFTIDSSGNVQSYLDGAAQATGSGVSLADVAHEFNIGAAPITSGGFPRFYTGLMSELALFSMQLSAGQVTALYNDGLGTYGIGGVPGVTAADVIAGYHLDGDFDDWTGHGNNGVNNGATFVPRASAGVPALAGASAGNSIATRTDSDDAGRVVRTIQNYQPQRTRLAPRDGAEWGEHLAERDVYAPGSDVNVTTLTAYTPDDNIARRTAVNPVTGDQTTTYLWGVTLATSAVARNDVLAAVLYPDAADSTDCVQYACNLQGETDQMQDQNGTVHQYVRDQLSRTTSDQVPTLGPGVDGTVQRIDTAFEIRGMVNQVTSFADTAGTSPVNQVSMVYGQFEQETGETQDNSASGGPVGVIGYAYNDGSNNSIAPLSTTYPDGAVLLNNYTATDDVALNRVTSLQISGEDSPLVTYGYFGLASFASVTYGTSTAVSMTLAAGASYPGFDLFGRVTNVSWLQGSALIAGLGYGYNLASSRTYRADLMAESLSLDFDELYGYDNLERLLAFNRGELAVLAARLFALALQQTWALDATGNWSSFSNLDLITPANSLVQERSSNRANEIVGIAATVSAPWATPIYDRNGNMTTIPQPAAPTSAYAGAFDAWNRLMSLNGAGYLYDGLHRRTLAATSDNRWFFMSQDWQVLDEYTDALAAYQRRYVWGLRYIDDLVLRDRVASGGTFNERFFVLQDANWNVVAIYNMAMDAVFERYAYTAYGVCQFLDASFSPLSGSAFDWTVLYTGRALDNSGLYYYRMRYYHPVLGVLVSRDPMPYVWRSTNLYQYAGGSPLTRIDPRGLTDYEVPHSVEDMAAAQCKYACAGAVLKEANLQKSSYDAQMFGQSEANKIRLNENSQENVALRHCFASAHLARSVGCQCAKCFGYNRERWQYWNSFLPNSSNSNTLRQAQEGEYNNRIGRRIAGCSGHDADESDSHAESNGITFSRREDFPTI